MTYAPSGTTRCSTAPPGQRRRHASKAPLLMLLLRVTKLMPRTTKPKARSCPCSHRCGLSARLSTIPPLSATRSSGRSAASRPDCRRRRLASKTWRRARALRCATPRTRTGRSSSSGQPSRRRKTSRRRRWRRCGVRKLSRTRCRRSSWPNASSAPTCPSRRRLSRRASARSRSSSWTLRLKAILVEAKISSSCINAFKK